MPGLVKMKRRLHGYKAEGQRFEGLDLRAARAAFSEWSGCSFYHCRMQAADFRNAVFFNCEFVGCDLSIANFSFTKIFGTRIAECQAEMTEFVTVQFRDVAFDENRMCYSNFDESIFRGASRFNRCNLHGANLCFSEADRIDWTLSNLWGAKVVLGCPTFAAGRFDDDAKKQFAALVAFNDEGGEFERIAGDRMPVVRRLMRAEADVDDKSA